MHLQWRKERSHLALANLNALSMASGTFLDLTDLLPQLRLIAILHNPVKDGRGDRRVLVRARPRFWNEKVGFIVVEVADEGRVVVVVGAVAGSGWLAQGQI